MQLKSLLTNMMDLKKKKYIYTVKYYTAVKHIATSNIMWEF